MQELLTDELVLLAAGLKRNTQVSKIACFVAVTAKRPDALLMFMAARSTLHLTCIPHTQIAMQAMQAAVEKRGDLLDQTDLELERNVGNAKRSAKEAGVAHKKYALSFAAWLDKRWLSASELVMRRRLRRLYHIA